MNRLYVPQVIVISLVFWVLNLELPHEYFTLLRWICFVAFTYLAVFAYVWNSKKLACIMGITAIIHNPIFPISCTKEIFVIIYLATTVFVLPLSFLIKYDKIKSTDLWLQYQK